jgi:hypothetical protein
MNTETLEPEVIDTQEVQTEEKPDLSHIPEHAREYVELDKYEADSDYKRAVDHKWKPYDKYVADGGDPALWTGYKKFNKSYDDEIFRRELRDKLKESEKSQKAILETFEEQKRQAVAQALAEREAQLKVAIEDGNAAEAVRLQREIMEGQSKIQPKQTVAEEPLPVIDMRRKNPALNPQSTDFNPEANAEFERICMERAQKYSSVYGRALSDLEVKIILDEALDMVKDKIQKPQAAKQPAKAPSAAKPAENKSANSMPRLSPDQKKMYEKMLTMKGGQQIAENYIKNLQNR